MHIVGRGFLAGSLRPLSSRYPGILAAAAGVSSSLGSSPADFARETALVERLIRRCLRSGERLLLFSTATAGMYSAPGSTGREDEPLEATTHYARHKQSLEHLVARSGADYLVLRLAHLVGARQPPHQLLPSLVRQIRSGRVTVFIGARRDLLDVTDMVTITEELLRLGLTRQVVNVASGVPVPVELIVEHFEARLGITARKDYVHRPDDHRVCIEKLRGLVPAVDSMQFDGSYFRAAIDRHLQAVDQAARAGAGLTGGQAESHPSSQQQHSQLRGPVLQPSPAPVAGAGQATTREGDR